MTTKLRTVVLDDAATLTRRLIAACDDYNLKQAFYPVLVDSVAGQCLAATGILLHLRLAEASYLETVQGSPATSKMLLDDVRTQVVHALVNGDEKMLLDFQNTLAAADRMKIL